MLLVSARREVFLQHLAALVDDAHGEGRVRHHHKRQRQLLSYFLLSLNDNPGRRPVIYVSHLEIQGVNSIESQQTFQHSFYSSVGHPVVLEPLLKSL